MIMNTKMNNENNIESFNESLSIESLKTTLEQNKPIEEIETKAKKIKNLEEKVISYFNSLKKLFKELKLERQQNDVQEGVEDSKLEKLKEALLVWVGIRDLFNKVVKEKYVSKKNRTNLEKKFDEFNDLLKELRSPETESKSKLQINEEAEPEAEQVQIEQIEPEAEQTQEVVENEAENTVIDTVLSKDNAQLEETTASNENNEKTEPKEKDNEEIKDFESVLFEIIENINTIDEFSEVLEKCKAACEQFNEKEKLLEALEKINESKLVQMWRTIIEERKEKIWKQIEEEIAKLRNLRIEIIKAGRDYLSANLKNESDKKSEFGKKMKEYEFCLKEMISLIVVVFENNNNNNNNLFEEQLDQELQLLSDKFTKLNERPDMKARDRRYFKDIEEEIKNYFSKGHKIIVKQIESLIKSKKVELKTSLDKRFAKEIKKEIDSILNEERINTIKQSKSVEQLISKINSIQERNNNQEKIDELIRELILSDKTDEEINDYIISINNILEKGASNLVIKEELDKIEAWLLKKFRPEEVENIYNDQIIPKLNKIIVQTLFFEIEKNNKKELTQEELQKLVEEAVKRNLFLVQQVEDVQNIDYVLYQADGDLINLGKEVENESIDNQDLEHELIEESKLKLLDSKKIGKGENIYNFFVGQDLKMKNGSAVLVREIKSNFIGDFIVVMEQSGNLIPIFHDEIKDKLQETPSLEMSKLSGSESKEQEKWNDLLGSVRDKFIRQPSSPDIFWEYQDALKQYFEANQDSFNNNYETFLDKEKTILEALGNKNFESVIENLKQSFAVAKEAMDNKARAEKKRAEENSKRNKTNETQTSSKEKTVVKPTTSTYKSTASSSPANVSSGGRTTRVEKQKYKESGKKFEFAGQEWNQIMSVYLLEENNKSTIIINKVEDDEIFFSANGIEQKMNKEKWEDMIFRSKELEERDKIKREEQEQAEEERIREIENLSDLYKSETTDSQETRNKREMSEDKVKDIFLKLSENFIGDSWVEDIKKSLKGKIENAKTIDETFFESLSPDEQFVFRFINGLYKESGTIQGFVNSDQLFYATNNEKGNNLFIIVDKSFKNILLKHDKPVRNYDGTLVEVEDGDIYPVKYNIVNNKIILERV